MTDKIEPTVDSGMDAKTVATAEWLWTNLPVGPRKWGTLPTHEKALICHTVLCIEDETRLRGERAGMERCATPEDDLAACERAIERMGWPEIQAFMEEPGQSPHEDAGGYLLRKIKALFGIKPDRLETYREAAQRLVAEARAQAGEAS